MRTTPRELGACTNSPPPIAMPTCDAPFDTVSKNTRSPGDTSAGSTSSPTRYWSRTSRGRRVPCCANTHWTNPLQSNPDGSEPPFRYGVPRNVSAIATSAGNGARGPGATSGGAAAVSGGVGGTGSPAPGGSAAPGNGRGVGTAPDEAQPVAAAA